MSWLPKSPKARRRLWVVAAVAPILALAVGLSLWAMSDRVTFFVTPAEATPEAAPVLRECDMLAWITPDDAPVYVNNPLADGPSRDRNHYLHHPAHAREIEKACEAAGILCVRVGAEASVKPLTDPVEVVLSILVGEDGGNGAGTLQ
jgi:hypothetical protein